ncbi:uncharacterized protein LOC116655094 isoform X1 [Drosophila ananassae]|uniref:uncharacterized protein LOC116655094 isoform X1 n=1 Tax=Drosophila ananassae TaxID=7217 RepID=UPI0013A5F0AA|nr:uncharacterized protein LOC116655094 isoform X1 [Drosophila ananassae]
MEQLKRIKGVRGRLKSSLTKLLYTAENSSASIGVDVEVLLVRPDKVWNDFELAGDDLSVLDVEGWVDPADDYGMYEAKYLKARALLFSLKRSQEPTTPTTKRHAKGDSIANNDAISRLVQQQQEFFERLEATLTPTQAEAAAPVRETELPKIHIKPFGGFYKVWPAFKALYISTVHSKQQKYHYLKSFLIDEAASLVRHLPISETAYDNAWERLNARYDRPRQIIHNLFDIFMELPSTNNREIIYNRYMRGTAMQLFFEEPANNGRHCRSSYYFFLKILQNILHMLYFNLKIV